MFNVHCFDYMFLCCLKIQLVFNIAKCSLRDKFDFITGRKVKSTGFWLHRTGILGASPDGLLGDGKGIVEFKCPYSIRNISVEEAIEANPKFYLKKNDDGVVFLHKDHAYYHQVCSLIFVITNIMITFVVQS